MASLPLSSSCQGHRQTGTGRSQIKWIRSRIAENVNKDAFLNHEGDLSGSGTNFCEMNRLLRHIRSVIVKINMEFQRKITGRENFAYSPMFHPWVQVMRIDWNSPAGGAGARTLVGGLYLLSFRYNFIQSHKGKHYRGLLGTSLMHFQSSLLTSAGDSHAVEPLWSAQGTFHACDTVWVLRQCWKMTRREIGSGFHSHHASLWWQRLL